LSAAGISRQKISMIVGQKVLCVNDQFALGTGKFYVALPKKDAV